MKEVICENCGCHIYDDYVLIGSKKICSECARKETVICSYCAERIWTDDNAGNENYPLCRHCYNRHFTTCESCGAIIHTSDAYLLDDDTEYCIDCYNSRRRHFCIHEHDYRPTPIFHGEGSRYFGVELEIDDGGFDNDSAKAILSIANVNGTDNLYCKSDSSLDCGFELVTHPMTLEYHITEMPWRDILDKAKSLGYCSHQAETCGLHIHVNRTSFGDTKEEQDICIARILYFFEKHWDELLKFSRRTPDQLERWASRYGYKDRPMDILDHAKGHNRYACVNLQNKNTIEFRMFRGTLKLNTLTATLQLVNEVCNAAVFMSDDDIKAMSWTTFVSCIDKNKFPELVTYLKERRLYVNEKVYTEEEI